MKGNSLNNKVKSLLNNINDDFSMFKELVIISNEMINIISSLNLNSKYLKTNKLSETQIIELAREIIEKINGKYTTEFDKFVENKKIKFSKIKNILNRDRLPIIQSEYVIKKKFKDNYIKLARRYTYNDVVDLVHEFMHHTNTDVIYDDILQDEWSEFISIYFETFAIKYLIDNKKIPKQEIDTVWRFNSILQQSYNNFIYVPLVMKEDYNNLSYDAYLKVIDKYDLKLSKNKNIYMYIINEFNREIESVNVLNKKYNDKNKLKLLQNKVFLDNRYFYGVVFTFILDDIDKNIVIMFNDYLKDNKYKKGKEAFDYIIYRLEDLIPLKKDLEKNIIEFNNKYTYKEEKSKVLKTNI